MATLQVTLGVPELSDVTLESWLTFLKTLDSTDTLAHAGPTSASLVSYWQSLTPHGQGIAGSLLRYVVLDVGSGVDPENLDDVVDVSFIEALSDVQTRLCSIRRDWSVEDKLHRLLERVSSDSLAVTLQALKEVKSLLDEQRNFFQCLASGDFFDSLIGRALRILSSAAARDVDGIEDIRLIAFECIGAIGALDPDRLDLGTSDSRPIVLRDFADEEESIQFAMHLIKDVLVSAFRSTSDMGYQTNLAYAIQEMLKFCQFNVSLMSSGGFTTSASLKARNRWNRLPKHVLETITPLLESRYTMKEKAVPAFDLPIYPHYETYREWLQQWTTYLISEAKGEAQKIFQPFRSVVRNKDVGVAHHLLPHLVLHALVSGNEEKNWVIRLEILAILQDQVNEDSLSSADKKFLSAQVISYCFSRRSLMSFPPRLSLCCWTILTNGFASRAGI
jgi:serine/threonine-protein kinase ATR